MQKTKNKKVYLSVTNDLIAEQRVNKVALTLLKCGFEPILVGVKFKDSEKFENKSYQTKRLKLFFRNSFLFYAEYNIRLFLYLLFKKTLFLVANDLDSLPANYLIFKIKKNTKIVYDSHEYYTETPELNNRKFVKKVWSFLEKLMLPNIKYSYTVCNSIANTYNQKYGIKMQVIRNLPICKNKESFNLNNISKPDFINNRKVILYQGAVNVGRGVEYVIKAMQQIKNAVFIIIGDGDIKKELEELVRKLKLNDKVYFIGKIPYKSLINYTKIADIGIVLCQNISKSYEFSLPNRIFDFIQSGIPILSSDLPEKRNIFEEAEIGILTNNYDAYSLAKNINNLLFDKYLILRIKENMKILSKKYCWEIEEKKLIEIFNSIIFVK